MRKIDAFFIGTSAGGIDALQMLFSRLPDTFSIPLVIVQHMPPNARTNPALVFGLKSKLTMIEAHDKTEIQPRHIYFSSPGYHLLVEKDGTLSLSQDDPVHFSRPSIDVLFESVALNYGHRACGILLTGANADGAEGLKAIQQAGGLTMVQDPEDSIYSTMPKAALALLKPDFVGSINDIAKKILEITSEVKHEQN
jgi:two-component system, chemotaxis family, protein-glutamate methylesterase/glutaminase